MGTVIGRWLAEQEGLRHAVVCGIAALSTIACARKTPESASETACRPVQHAALEGGGRGPARGIPGWGLANFDAADDARPDPVVLSVGRGAEECVRLIDSVGSPAPPAEDAVIAIRLSDDGGTLWVNNQLSETLTPWIEGHLQDGSTSRMTSCPVAPNWVVELSLDPRVQRVTVPRFWFGDVAADEQAPHCHPH